MGCFNNFKGAVVRLLFVLHIWLCVWRLVDEKNGEKGWWAIGAGAALLLFVEAAITLGCTKHGEWRRFVPCIFIYLLGTVPALCLTEWELLQRRIIYQSNTGTCPSFTVNTTSSLDVSALNIGGVSELNYNWSLALQQGLVILLVAGRWLLPKGKMSREKLSNILLAYIGMAADILEFYSEGIQTDAIRCEKIVVLVILCLWAVSLIQFALELSHGQKKRSKSLSQINESLLQRCRNTDVWSIIVIVVMQDGPFLGMRLYLIIVHNIYDQGLIFFTFKNILIVLLQMYRLWILLCLTWDASEGKFSFRLVASVRNRGGNEDNNNRHFSVSVEQENEVFEMDHFYPQRENNRPQSPQPTSLPVPGPTFPPQQRANHRPADFGQSVRNPGHHQHQGRVQNPPSHSSRPQSPHQGNPQHAYHQANSNQGFRPYSGHQGQRAYNEQRSHPYNGQENAAYVDQEHNAYNRRYPGQTQQAPYSVGNHAGNQYFGRR
ncbi:transmembrane protein 26-like [Amphiura filiformis]|uniref:transmembrane protein 26-like n=1 Tax=Amphiura filiformis TaxID=82378 RepID=UPI003B215DCB